MARTKTRRNRLREEIEKLKQTVLDLDRTIHQKDQYIKKIEERNSFVRDNFSLVTTILNTTRFNLKQLARQAAKENNTIMACVFEFLYADLANFGKYKRMMNKEEDAETVTPIDFGIPECDKF